MSFKEIPSIKPLFCPLLSSCIRDTSLSHCWFACPHRPHKLHEARRNLCHDPVQGLGPWRAIGVGLEPMTATWCFAIQKDVTTVQYHLWQFGHLQYAPVFRNINHLHSLSSWFIVSSRVFACFKASPNLGFLIATLRILGEYDTIRQASFDAFAWLLWTLFLFYSETSPSGLVDLPVARLRSNW